MNLKQNRFTIFAVESIFNPDRINQVDYFSIEHTILLKSFILQNTIEQLQSSYPEDGINVLLNSEDQSFIPDFLLSDLIQLVYWEKLDRDFLFSIIESYFSNNLDKIIFHNQAIGFTSNDINKASSLISQQDNIVFGKSESEFISFIAFCNIDADTLIEFVNPNFHYDKFLSAINRNDHFVNILSNFMIINDFNNFNKLYHELSKKESEAYCSQKMHEKFTHLFIEYKELLK